jgi:outer membrane lipoprotein carrier protein
VCGPRDRAHDFRQEIELATLGQKFSSRGSVYYRKPGFMRWEFVAPEPQTVVADGTTLWIYQAAQRQVIRLALTSAFRTATPMSFLVGLGKIRDDFRARLVAPARDGRVVLHLVPHATGGDVGALELTLDAATYDILAAKVTDPTGSVTRWEFASLQRDVDLADDLFRFEPPPGVDVVQPPAY